MTDWSKCPAVEGEPGKMSGAWVFTDERIVGVEQRRPAGYSRRR